MMIRPALVTSIAIVVAALAAPTPASALTCYQVLDRSDNVIYRDTYPPVDLSDQGAAERERMRRRGEHMIAMESDRCPSLEFFIGNAGSATLSVDDVVGGMPVRTMAGGSSSGGAAGAAGAASGRAAAAPPTRRAR